MHCAAAEVGQGVSDVILQVARLELGTDDVVLASGSTARVGSAGSASASRMTWMAAGAVQTACRAALEERERAGGGAVDVERIYRHPRTFPLDPETGQITDGQAHVALAVAAMRVVVEVDVDLGLTRVVWIGTAQDVGNALNRTAVEGQIEGGTAQGLGLALMEEIQTRDGVITNASFTDYLIPTFLDMPPVVSELVEDPEPDAPYGVKGVGEPPTVVSTAAIVAALRDATGPRARPRARSPGRHRRALPRSEPRGANCKTRGLSAPCFSSTRMERDEKDLADLCAEQDREALGLRDLHEVALHRDRGRLGSLHLRRLDADDLSRDLRLRPALDVPAAATDGRRLRRR